MRCRGLSYSTEYGRLRGLRIIRVIRCRIVVPGFRNWCWKQAGAEKPMSKSRDTKPKENRKKPEKTLKEKRADKAAKKAGTFRGPGSVGKVMEH